MREKHSLCFVAKKFSQRTPHFFFIRAIFCRQKSKPIRLKVNQCIANDQRPAAWRVMQNDFASDCALDATQKQPVTNLVPICNFPELARHIIRECFAARKDRNRELLGKLSRSTTVIGICHDNSGNTAGGDELVRRFALQRNWINKISTAGSQDASRVKVRFNGRFIAVPKREVWGGSVKIGHLTHGVTI